MGKNKNKKNRNSNNNASSAADVIASGVSFQHVSKEKLGKTKTKKDTVEHGTQSKTSKRSRNKNEIDQAVANEYGSEIEQSINLLEIDNKETNKSIDKYESHNDSTANTTVGILSQEHDANAAQDNNKMFVSISKSKNASTNDKDKNRRKASLDNGHKENEWRTSQYSASFHRTDESKNWRQEDTVHDYSSSNPSNSHNKESREKNYGGSKYKRSNNNKHSFGSNGNCRNEQSKTGNSNFNDEDDFLSKSNADYTKAKYDKYKDTQINRNLNYSDRHWSEIESSHKVLSKTLHYSNIQMLEKFVDDKKFHLWLQNNKDKFSCVTEVEGDLFDSSEDSCLAHCVAEDMSMGSGIAVSFRKNFKSVPYLLNQRQRSGGLAILEDKNRFIYYLVTKKHSKGKPTLSTLWSSLNKLRNHMVENNAMALSIPRIGCGLDRLEWCEVKHMIEYLFFETGINVTVYNLPKQSDIEDLSTKQQVRNCKVVHVDYSLIKIDEYTIIVYLCSEEGEKTEQIKTLDKKFKILSSYSNSRKTLGSVIRHEKGNYIVYGFVVKTKPNDNIDFMSFQKCIYELNSRNAKDRFDYVAIQEFSDPQDDLLFDKIINLMRNGLKYVDVYVCQPDMGD